MPISFFIGIKIKAVSFFNFWKTLVLFAGPLISLFWTFGGICSGFQSPHLCALSPLCNGFLRFTPGATLADPLAVSMVAKLFLSTYLQIMCPQTLMGVRTHDQACCCTMLFLFKKFRSQFYDLACVLELKT